MVSAFHVGGLWFQRLVNGGVSISRGRNAPELVEAILDKDEWASVVASVAQRGDQADVFNRALQLHMEEEP